MIYLLPHSGLANRIRVIVSGLSFAAIRNQKLTLIWRKDNSLNCEFYQLFEMHESFYIYNYNIFFRLLNHMRSRIWLKSLIYRLFQIDFSLFDDDMQEYVWKTGTDRIDYNKIPAKAKKYFISTCNEFHFDRQYLRYLKPVKSIQERVDAIAFTFTKSTVGVHIRRTDHCIAIEKSPLHLFIEAMNSEIKFDSETKFFLATDDRETEQILGEIFRERIIIPNRELSRMTSNGMQDAMIDLYCLARTNKIYGSYFSSFSDLASRIGNINLIVLQVNT